MDNQAKQQVWPTCNGYYSVASLHYESRNQHHAAISFQTSSSPNSHPAKPELRRFITSYHNVFQQQYNNKLSQCKSLKTRKR